MKDFEAKAGENTCKGIEVELEKKFLGVRKYYHFPVTRFALAETLVALANTEGVREISISFYDGELAVDFRFYEKWERDTQGVSCVPYESNKNKEKTE